MADTNGLTTTIATVTTLGANITALRQGRNLKQQELAERIGTSASTVNNWERGRKVDLPASTLLALAKALNVSIEALLCDVDPEYAAQRDREPSRVRLIALCASLTDVQCRLLIPMAETLLYQAPRAGSLPDEETP